MTALDDAVESLTSTLGHLQDAAAADVENLFWNLSGPTWDAESKRRLVDELREILPDVLTAHVGIVADVTADWYDDLAPDEPFAATAPEDVVPVERIETSIGWAVNAATSMETALSRLVGTTQRMVLDAQRATVAHNAAAEGVKYLRHCNYGGACNWCLAMATRGAVYSSAATAVRGHDRCKCIAVPVRSGTSYTAPKMVRDAEVRYGEAHRQIEAEGASPTLANVVKRMDAIDAAKASA